MNHTAGTWKCVREGWHFTVYVNGRPEIGQIVKEDDARRIVACVNACEGISTEALELFRVIVKQGNVPHTAHPFFCPKCGNAHDASIMCKPIEDSPREWAKGDR